VPAQSTQPQSSVIGMPLHESVIGKIPIFHRYFSNVSSHAWALASRRGAACGVCLVPPHAIVTPRSEHVMIPSHSGGVVLTPASFMLL